MINMFTNLQNCELRRCNFLPKYHLRERITYKSSKFISCFSHTWLCSIPRLSKVLCVHIYLFLQLINESCRHHHLRPSHFSIKSYLRHRHNRAVWDPSPLPCDWFTNMVHDMIFTFINVWGRQPCSSPEYYSSCLSVPSRYNSPLLSLLSYMKLIFEISDT